MVRGVLALGVLALLALPGLEAAGATGAVSGECLGWCEGS